MNINTQRSIGEADCASRLMHAKNLPPTQSSVAPDGRNEEIDVLIPRP